MEQTAVKAFPPLPGLYPCQELIPAALSMSVNLTLLPS